MIVRSTSLRWPLLLAGSLIGQTFAARDPADAPPVRIDLRAPWTAPPPLLEIVEAVNSVNSSAFFDAVSALAAAGIASDARLTHKDLYERSTELLESKGVFTAPGSREVFDLSLALHSESPKVEAFSHLYRTTSLEALYDKHVSSDAARAACGSWVDVDGRVACSASELEQALSSVQPNLRTAADKVPFDHIYAPSSAAIAAHPTRTVLYADLSSANFVELHDALVKHASGETDTPAQYILRWRPSTASGQGTVYLSSYGAALDLKKVDYLVIDDRKLRDDTNVSVTGVAADDPIASLEQANAQQSLEDRRWLQAQAGAAKGSTGAEDVGAEISDDDLLFLGYKAAQVIAQSDQPLRALRELSQNFPFHAKQISQVKLSKATREEIAHNQHLRTEAGANDLWLNGKSFPHKEVSPLGFLKRWRAEAGLLHSLTDASRGIGLDPASAIDLLSNTTLGKAFIGGGAEQVAVDASDRIERGLRTLAGEVLEHTGPSKPRAILWWNDLEKDDAFKKWPTNLQMLLQPMWPGQFPQIARNMFNIVLALDLTRKESCRFLAETVFPASKRVGLHWGMVPLWDDAQREGLIMTRMFLHIFDQAGPEGAARYLRRVGLSGLATTTKITLQDARKEFTAALEALASDDEIKEVLAQIEADDSTVMSGRLDAAKAYSKRVGAATSKELAGHVFVNGFHVPFSPAVGQAISQIVQGQVQALAPLIYYGTIDEDTDLAHYFYDLEDSITYRSPLLSPGAANITTRAINLAAANAEALTDGPLSRHFALPEPTNVTIYVAGDLDSTAGQSLVQAARSALGTTPFRLGLLHRLSSPQSDSGASTLLYMTLAPAAAGTLETEKLATVFPSADEPATAFISAARKAASGSPAASMAAKWWTQTAPMLEGAGCGGETTCLIVNGRVLVGLQNTTVSGEDIAALAQLENRKRAKRVGAKLAELLPGRAAGDRPVELASSVLAAAYAPDEAEEGIFRKPPTVRLSAFDAIEIKHSGFEIGDRKTAAFRLTAIIDPLSESAQQWSSVLEMASRWPGTYIKVILNPVAKLTEVPLWRFYRYKAPGRVAFREDGALLREPILFSGMPEDAVLTLGLDTPSVWLAMAEDAVYDLDNIRLRDVPSASRSAGVSATYELKRILIEGHAREGATNAIPRGLQLVLATSDGQEALDTIVMENLAYFQFRARPGLWHLRLREGRSSDIYEMRSVGNLGWRSPGVERTGDVVTLASLEGLTIYPQVRKRPGKEDEELLEELDTPRRAKGEGKTDSDSLAGRAKALFGSLTKKAAANVPAVVKPASPHADINIFTVASGHLYERMTYIMILSVLRNTKHSVKFWFIENFLSPSFKEFIPHYAREYGFTYELVAYAWPHWLRAQKEKQRVIWGNKILFLDVLFPLDLDKVIFVDADQIVRADMAELVAEDLHGAPYGYPPMGDDSADMDGFRFWKHGYWASHLAGKPYHISALYVVDLQRFRQVAAGDRLRGQYQALSADAGSLANLDQDLPNNLQHTLPIHTLDKTWLWCETWCSAAWLPQAKTIDLCSNPKTKEPKLDRARRQIPEWTRYDDEIAAFAARLSEAQRIGTNVVSAKESEHVDSADAAAEAPAHTHDEL